ncbi:hypothetical protein ACOMHN_042943 [Nucella lapillus]
MKGMLLPMPYISAPVESQSTSSGRRPYLPGSVLIFDVRRYLPDRSSSFATRALLYGFTAWTVEHLLQSLLFVLMAPTEKVPALSRLQVSHVVSAKQSTGSCLEGRTLMETNGQRRPDTLHIVNYDWLDGLSPSAMSPDFPVAVIFSSRNPRGS